VDKTDGKDFTKNADNFNLHLRLWVSVESSGDQVRKYGEFYEGGTGGGWS
jgi:hypothetical protein